MSLQPVSLPRVPRATAWVARQAFAHGNAYLFMRDELGAIYRDADFRDLFPCVGQPALAPWRLALVCVMQFAENLSDRQVANAVRARIDWKYDLALELDDSGFDFSVLSEFRARLLTGGADQRLLEIMLTRFRERGWLKARGRQRTDSTRVLAAVRTSLPRSGKPCITAAPASKGRFPKACVSAACDAAATGAVPRPTSSTWRPPRLSIWGA